MSINKGFSLYRRALLAILIILVTAVLTAPTQVEGQQNVPRKRSLTHQDYDSWQSLNGSQISADGRFIAYSLIPQDGDGELVVHRLDNGKEWRFPRGWRQPAPLPDDPEAAQAALANLNRVTRPVFTADTRFLLFTIEPLKEAVLKARREKKKADEMPRNALGMINLETGDLVRIERVKNFQVPEDAGDYVAVLENS